MASIRRPGVSRGEIELLSEHQVKCRVLVVIMISVITVHVTCISCIFFSFLGNFSKIGTSRNRELSSTQCKWHEKLCVIFRRPYRGTRVRNEIRMYSFSWTLWNVQQQDKNITTLYISQNNTCNHVLEILSIEVEKYFSSITVFFSRCYA